MALALLGVALAAKDWGLVAAAVFAGLAAAFLEMGGYSLGYGYVFGNHVEQSNSDVLVALVGAVMVVAGILTYRTERSRT